MIGDDGTLERERAEKMQTLTEWACCDAIMIDKYGFRVGELQDEGGLFFLQGQDCFAEIVVDEIIGTETTQDGGELRIYMLGADMDEWREDEACTALSADPQRIIRTETIVSLAQGVVNL